MRLTNAAQLRLPDGQVRSYVVGCDAAGLPLPVSFDQERHVGLGQRPGSWMAAAFRLRRPRDATALAHAWLAVIRRHGTLQSAFSAGAEGVVLHELPMCEGQWAEHVPGERHACEVVREVLDTACAPYARPSHRMVLVTPYDGTDPTLIIGADHAHVDAWSLLVLARDMLTALDDVEAGVEPFADTPAVPAFADHTAALAARPPAPREVRRRWAEIIAAGAGAMPTFPVSLGDISRPRPEVVEVRDVLNADQLMLLERSAQRQGVRMISVAMSVMTSVCATQADVPLRAILPVHSRDEARWHDCVGWFITNAVIESADPDPRACARSVAAAIELGSHALAPIMAAYGGMPATPGMFAISWLDHRRLPVALPDGLEPQHVSAVMDTDGVMVWFVVNETGLHVRCRYPGTATARRNVGRWLDEVCAGLADHASGIGTDVALR